MRLQADGSGVCNARWRSAASLSDWLVQEAVVTSAASCIVLCLSSDKQNWAHNPVACANTYIRIWLAANITSVIGRCHLRAHRTDFSPLPDWMPATTIGLEECL